MHGLEILLGAAAALLTAIATLLGVRYKRQHDAKELLKTTDRANFDSLTHRMDAFMDRQERRNLLLEQQLAECEARCTECKGEHAEALRQINELRRRIDEVEDDQS